MKAYSTVAARHNLKETTVRHIYEKYLKLIHDKALETYRKLEQSEAIPDKEMFDNRGDYCFYLRYLGRYYINHKAYQKWKSKTLRK